MAWMTHLAGRLKCLAGFHLPVTIGEWPASIIETRMTVYPLGGVSGCGYCSRGSRVGCMILPASDLLRYLSQPVADPMRLSYAARCGVDPMVVRTHLLYDVYGMAPE